MILFLLSTLAPLPELSHRKWSVSTSCCPVLISRALPSPLANAECLKGRPILDTTHPAHTISTCILLACLIIHIPWFLSMYENPIKSSIFHVKLVHYNFLPGINCMQNFINYIAVINLNHCFKNMTSFMKNTHICQHRLLNLTMWSHWSPSPRCNTYMTMSINYHKVASS